MNAPPPRDPGLQPERTLLAWQRTVFLLAVVALLFLRVPSGRMPLGMVGQGLVALTVVGVALVLAVHLRRRWYRGGRGTAGTPPAPLARPWVFALLGVVTAGLGVVAALTVLLP